MAEATRADAPPAGLQRPSAAALLELDRFGVTFHTPRGDLSAVENVTLQIGRAEAVGLVGESGSGKSALALGIIHLLPDYASISGEMRLDGVDITRADAAVLGRLRGRQIGMIFQDPNATLNPTRTIGGQLVETIRHHRATRRTIASRTAADLLGQVGLPAPARQLARYPYELSGGMKQRVMIALALAGEPELLIADEATTALDVSLQAQILTLLREIIAQRAMSLLMITHDLGVAATVADRMVVMYSGRLAEIGSTDDVFTTPEHPYTAALIRCIPVLRGGPRHSLPTIRGTIPDPSQRSSGCAFAPRCALAENRCAQLPDLTIRPARAGFLAGSGSSVPGASPTRARAAHLAACWLTQDGHPAFAEQDEADAATASPTVDEETDEPSLLTVRQMSVRYRLRRGILRRGPSHLLAVDGVTFDIAPGRTLGLVGESGSGKSSVARAVLQLESAEGSVQFAGRELSALSKRELRRIRPQLQLVMQDITTSMNPTFTVADVISEPITAHSIVKARERPAYIAGLLGEVSLPADFADAPALSLSGGQRQRVNIARALASRPSLVVADEPTSALDLSVRAQVLNLLQKLQQERDLAYLFISHDLAVIRQMSDVVAVMYLGQIVEYGPRDDIFEAPRHPYTRALLAAVPTVENRASESVPIRGEIPEPGSTIGGCAFRERCPRARTLCAESSPKLDYRGGGHPVACFFPEQ